jgi:integrase/recombinase XerD
MDSSASPEWHRNFPRCANDARSSAFIDYLFSRGYSRNTVSAYGRAMESALEMAGPLDPLEFNRAYVIRYLAWVRKTPSKRPGSLRRPLALATVAQRLVGLRAFADYLIDCGQLDRNPVMRGGSRRTPEGHVIRTRRGLCPLPGRVPRIPDDTQWLELLRVLRPRCVRDRLMFVLAYDGALRRNELAGLWLSDIDFSARTMTIRQEASKTGVQRTVPYSATSSLLLREYLPHRRKVAGRVPHLFVSESPRNHGGNLSGYTWGRLASELADQARLPFFSTHTLRHLRLTDLARSGFDIKELALFAGHRSFDSTLTYIHLSGRDMSRAFQRAADTMTERVELL